MNELKRSYNTLMFNGEELECVILTDGQEFIKVNANNVYFKDVIYYGGQSFETTLDTEIKKGNKRNIDLEKELPLNRVLSSTSISHDVNKKLQDRDYKTGGGNFLFLKVDFDNMTTVRKVNSESETYDHIREIRTFEEFKGLKFVTYISESSDIQCRNRLYENLKALSYFPISDFIDRLKDEGKTRYKLRQDLEFYDLVINNAEAFTVKIRKDKDKNDVSCWKGVIFYKGKEVHYTGIDSSDKGAQEFVNKYDFNTLVKHENSQRTLKRWI